MTARWVEAPSTNIQAPEKHQPPNNIGVLRLGFFWDLPIWRLGFAAFRGLNVIP
jgi:hypothetical protein